MKKRRRSGLMAPSPATPHMQMKWSAESVAETAMRNHPKFRKVRDMITHEVMAATERSIRKVGGKGK